MEKVYIIIEENGYDGYYPPSGYFYLTEEEAQKDCDQMNKAHNSRRDYCNVEELELKK